MSPLEYQASGLIDSDEDVSAEPTGLSSPTKRARLSSSPPTSSPPKQQQQQQQQHRQQQQQQTLAHPLLQTAALRAEVTKAQTKAQRQVKLVADFRLALQGMSAASSCILCCCLGLDVNDNHETSKCWQRKHSCLRCASYQHKANDCHLERSIPERCGRCSMPRFVGSERFHPKAFMAPDCEMAIVRDVLVVLVQKKPELANIGAAGDGQKVFDWLYRQIDADTGAPNAVVLFVALARRRNIIR
jgi:hypothetical protein